MSAQPTTSGIVLASGSIQTRSGPPLPSGAEALIKEMLGARPAARKFGEGVLCTAPSKAGSWLFRHIARPESGVSVADYLQQLGSEALAEVATDTSFAKSPALGAAVTATRMLRRSRLNWFAAELAGQLNAQIVAIVQIGPTGPGGIWLSDPDAISAQDELRQFVRLALQDKDSPRLRRFAARDHRPEGLDAGLLAERFGAEALAIALPDDLESGFAVVVAGPAAPDWLMDVPAITQLIVGGSGSARPKVWHGYRFRIAMAAVVAATIWMVMPVPIQLSGQARAIPSASVVTALPFASFVDAVNVQPGDHVTPGETVAHMRAPDLEARRSEQLLTHSLEKLNADVALDQGDYAGFQLAESRIRIAELRIAQIDERLAMLDVVAEVAGTVTESLAVGDKGTFLQAGTTIVRIQPAPEFDVLIDLPAADAPLVKIGQTGVVRFRGMAENHFGLLLGGVPQQKQDAQTGATTLQVRARITDGPQDRLLVSLTGIARIEAGTGPRIANWLRPALAYMRYLGWKHFGLQT